MPVLNFPPVELADKNGLLAVGGDLSVRSLLHAYRSGIFPWPFDEHLLAWFSPPKRAVLLVNQLHISRSLKKTLRKETYSVTFNKAFAEVVTACAATPRPGQPGTWITPAIKKAYQELFTEGHAFSVEAWLEGKLVGGIYGIKIAGYLAAESMFHHADDAAKVALVHLVSHLEKIGVHWIDCQVLNPFLATLGVTEISRAAFLSKLHAALRMEL